MTRHVTTFCFLVCGTERVVTPKKKRTNQTYILPEMQTLVFLVLVLTVPIYYIYHSYDKIQFDLVCALKT